MASLYERPNSPFIYLKTKFGKARSTKLRKDSDYDRRKALDLLELENRRETVSFSAKERFDQWVPAFIAERYEESPRTHAKVKFLWRTIRAFLMEHAIDYPRQITFEHGTKFVPWRRAGSLAWGVRARHKNTALEELKFFKLLLNRAVQLGYIERNPLLGLRIKKAPPKEKREITDEHFVVIMNALKTAPEWMQVQFAICYYTGCRLTESCVPLDCVDTNKKFIHFPHPKGDKPFTVPLRKELVPLFKRLQQERPGQAAFDLPRMASITWCRFFQNLGLPYSLHCTRVTFITKAARAGIPISETMRLVNHASQSVHRIYQKLQPEDLRASLDKLDLPGNVPRVPCTKPTPRQRQRSGS